MKRRTLKVLACATMMAMTLSVTACGSSDAAETTETVEEAEETEAEVEEAAEEEIAEAEEAAEEEEATTLEEYYNDPTVKAVLDSSIAGMAEDGMSAAIEVEENTMTMIIKIEDESLIVDGMAEYLDSALDSVADQFEAQVATFDEVIGQEGACTVVMRYTDPDDNVIAEKSFKAQ